MGQSSEDEADCATKQNGQDYVGGADQHGGEDKREGQVEQAWGSGNGVARTIAFPNGVWEREWREGDGIGVRQFQWAATF